MKRIVAETENKQTYYATFQVDASFSVEVEASTVEEAKALADEKWENCNIGDLSILDADLISVEDEEGNSVYEYDYEYEDE